MAAIPTIKVKRDGPRGFRIINLSDFNPAVHVALDEAPAPVAPSAPAAAAPVVAKGPKGLWFVMDGDARVSRGFKTEAEAIASVEG
jgi:hypothetical protein